MTETKPTYVKLNRVERARLLDIGRREDSLENAADAMFTELAGDPKWEHLEAVVISDYTWAAARFCFPQEAKYW
jgi:hypothetical protein